MQKNKNPAQPVKQPVPATCKLPKGADNWNKNYIPATGKFTIDDFTCQSDHYKNLMLGSKSHTCPNNLPGCDKSPDVSNITMTQINNNLETEMKQCWKPGTDIKKLMDMNMDNCNVCKKKVYDLLRKRLVKGIKTRKGEGIVAKQNNTVNQIIIDASTKINRPYTSAFFINKDGRRSEPCGLDLNYWRIK